LCKFVLEIAICGHVWLPVNCVMYVASICWT